MIKSLPPIRFDRWKSLLETEIRLHLPSRSKHTLFEALARADVVVHSGGGFINDEFAPVAMQRLDLVMKAVSAGKPTAMFSQGIGPIEQAPLFTAAAKVLPSVNFITLRESVSSYPILRSMGVDPSRISSTGDDAIALAYQQRTEDLGSDLGVNIRLARYSGLSPDDGKLLGRLRSSITKVAESHGAAIIPIPISEDDCQSLRTLFKDDIRSLDTACEERNLSKVLDRVTRCRVVITGSYHAAVFALSQGNSAVCLVRSGYYAQKFLGLADQFGDGCRVMFLDEPHIGEQLDALIDNSWRRAARHRSQLLETAKRQIEAAEAAYRGFFDLVNNEL